MPVQRGFWPVSTKVAVCCSTAKAGVTKSVSAGKTVAGFPAIDIDVWRRQMVELRVMAKKKMK